MARRRRPRGLQSGRRARRRGWIAPLVLGFVLTLGSTVVKQRTLAPQAAVEACTGHCTVAAAGWPLPYVVDDPGVSPVDSVSLAGAVMGVDRVRPESLVADLVFWTVASFVLFAIGRRFRT